MRPFPIIELEPPGNAPCRLRDAAVVVQVNLFVLERTPQPFHEDVVKSPAAAIHGDPDLLVQEPFRESLARELAPLVAVEDPGFAESQGFLQRFQAETRVQGVGQLPGQDVAAVPVHDRHQVEETVTEADVGDVRSPNLVRGNDLQVPQKVRVNTGLFLGFAQPGLRIDRFQPHEPHEPPDSFLVHRKTGAGNQESQPSSAKERPGRVQFVNFVHQVKVLGTFSSRLVIVRGSWKPQKFALPDNRDFGTVLAYEPAFFLIGQKRVFF